MTQWYIQEAVVSWFSNSFIKLDRL